MIDIRSADSRGKADFGWLQSRHSFSFASYYDPAHMGFSDLRVINDDRVLPRAGFDTHGHRDMEIISYVLAGAIRHRDSTGTEEVLRAGEFQLMSAGRGILHSEYNASDSEELRFLQIWIEPNQRGGTPGYQQKDFGMAPGLTLVASPDGADGSLQMRQDARLYQLMLAPGDTLEFSQQPGRCSYVHMVKGQLELADSQLGPGDAAKVSELAAYSLRNVGREPLQALLFDLA
ncbi:pirin family protein [Vogesella amnigena]|uniref:Pirin family protein n=1 Tax=Vogesella amnigena TaxID=1507449 RepID=A0ABV7TST7_9NEIS